MRIEDDSKIVVFGCGSQALYVLENRLSWGHTPPEAFVNIEDQPSTESTVEGVPVLSFTQAIRKFEPGTVKVIVAHGSNSLKLQLVESLLKMGYIFFSSVNRGANISPLAMVGTGCIVNAGVTILSRARLHNHVIVHSGSVIEHDCVLSEGVNVAPGVTLAGRVVVSKCAYLYSGSIIGPGVTIGEAAVVSAGAVVLEPIDNGVRVAGCPARVI